MHSSIALATLFLAASAATPALAVPLRENQAQARAAALDLSTREPGLSSILKPLATGLLGGAAVPLLEHFLGGGSDQSSTPAQRRDSFNDQIKEILAESNILPASKRELRDALEARDSIIDKIKAIIAKFSNISSTSKREQGDILEARDSIIDKIKEIIAKFSNVSSASKRELTDALEARDSIPDINELKEIIAKFGSIIPKDKRELEERLNLGPIEKGLLGTVTSLGVSGAASGLLGKLFGGDDSSSRRDVDELAARSILGSLLGATEDSLGTVLKTSAAGGLAAGAVGAAGSEIEKLLGVNQPSSRRELEERDVDPTPEQILAAVILSSRAFNDLD